MCHFSILESIWSTRQYKRSWVYWVFGCLSMCSFVCSCFGFVCLFVCFCLFFVVVTGFLFVCLFVLFVSICQQVSANRHWDLVLRGVSLSRPSSCKIDNIVFLFVCWVVFCFLFLFLGCGGDCHQYLKVKHHLKKVIFFNRLSTGVGQQTCHWGVFSPSRTSSCEIYNIAVWSASPAGDHLQVRMTNFRFCVLLYDRRRSWWDFSWIYLV